METCRGCGQQLDVTPQLRDQPVACPFCGTVSVFPSTSPPSPSRSPRPRKPFKRKPTNHPAIVCTIMACVTAVFALGVWVAVREKDKADLKKAVKEMTEQSDKVFDQLEADAQRAADEFARELSR